MTRRRVPRPMLKWPESYAEQADLLARIALGDDEPEEEVRYVAEAIALVLQSADSNGARRERDIYAVRLAWITTAMVISMVIAVIAGAR